MTSQPNVVFMVVDNVGCDVGCYGGTAPTPRIDAFAAQGMRFRNYNVEAQCTPTLDREQIAARTVDFIKRNAAAGMNSGRVFSVYVSARQSASAAEAPRGVGDTPRLAGIAIVLLRHCSVGG